MTKDLQKKAALVTGASSGIGEAAVRALRADGWTVFAVARRAERLAALESETGAVAIPADIAEDDDVSRLLAQVTDAGGIDTLVNIAGGARGADKVGDASTADWEWMYRVNVLGTMKLTRAFLPMLRATGEGTVLNLTSTAGLDAYE
ncbi:MAG TPA: SDR family NAD(P)-dependent oxidoreductase, partial [Arthrobacter sp.]